MKTRLAYDKLAPEGFRAMLGLEKYVHQTSLEPNLIHLVKLRASQVNGCAYCIDMHWKDLRAAGETEQRLYGLDAWRESPYYTDRECAALEWTEAVTLVSQTHVPDASFEAVRAQFSEKEIVELTWVIAAINVWNRMAISVRARAGTYQPPAAARQHPVVEKV